ncbi:GDSL esterase/lipase At1g28600-like [Zingiber officinale]|uniref:GDSL esterase/lipase At1g28600-like n=1 Tax=Zingiber officinale TaxID=94328 RepID=UPI001C4BE342|nr:GDSL esterase/lipase At1g28600-like [Zingiber officinale]
MASSSFSFFQILSATTTLLLLLEAHQASSCFSAIFSFGDSLQDTGNAAHMFVNSALSNPPYGTTYFHKATGRYCDGRIILDFIAESLGLPFVPPFLVGGDFSKGANFAFGGAVAVKSNPNWNNTLPDQIQWFQKFVQTDPLFRDPNFLANSLIMMGEIGGNDYNAGLGKGLPYNQLIQIVPSVVQAIGSAITTLIGLGAKTFVVPGNLPIGCIPAWLGQYRSDKPSDYDRNGCLIWMNNFSEYHNNHLQTELDRLKGQFPNVNIAYADYLNSGIRMFSNQAQFGITVPFTACCGGNGYPCNATGPVCPNPLNHASWEGFHPTEATYHAISDGIIRGPYAIPFLSQKC